MENAEKVQEVSKESDIETPENVQQEAELSSSNEEENQIATDEDQSPSKDETSDQEENTTSEKESKDQETSEVSEQEDNSSPEMVGESSGSESEEEENLEDEVLDFDNASKEELLAKIKEVSKEDRIRRVDRVIKALKPRFDLLWDEARSAALKKFEEEGNDPDSFEFHGDEIDKEFQGIYRDLRTKRNKFFKELESQKEENLKQKEQLLEQLRVLVDGEESTSSNNSVKALQEEWKKTGPVPAAQNKTLWANYNALLDRYYDQRSIYFELKDLDRKKNLTLKLGLCEKAEALVEMEDLKVAIVQLNELHEEYKHAGPVPREEQEAVWQRFKTASDAVYARRKDYFEQLKGEFEENYKKKLELAQKAETYSNFESDKISDWNAKTKEIQELQKQWEGIGGLPKDKAKATNKQFWGSFKTFFNHKNQFFKQLESMRDENLMKKEELILQAEELKDSEDWNGTTQKFKDLQAQWKEIGPVPEKVRNETYKRFKAAGDHFFDKRRSQNSEQDKEYEENLKLKMQICSQIENIADQDEINLDDVYDLIDNHNQLGFVPRNAIKKAHNRFDSAVNKILSLEELEEGDKQDLKRHIQMGRSRNSPGGDRKVQRQEHSIRRKISELENDISTWNTNMEFFAASAAADKLKADLQQKINSAKGELEDLKSQLSSLSS